MHLEELQTTNVRCAKSETHLWKLHGERFAQWVNEKVITLRTFYTILSFQNFGIDVFCMFSLSRSLLTLRIIQAS